MPMQARGGLFGEQVFLCLRGRRHPVLSVDRLEQFGFRWPDDVAQVDEQMLACFAPGGPVPRSDARHRPLTDASAARERLSADLDGFGLEIGAGASPFPVPLSCRVIYGDRLTHRELLAECYPGQRSCDIVIPDILTDFDSIENVADGSLDFLIACHVIEHTRDPIGSIAAAHRKLRSGGRLLLVVPDKTRTFDRDRPVTPLDHLLADHDDPDRERDRMHYEEFYRLALPVPPERLDETVETKFQSRYAIHYHVWTRASFDDMLAAVQARVCRWESMWTHGAVGDPALNNEFYAQLVKP